MDRDLYIRDFTFPYVGMLNHLSGHKIRLGIWVSGQFAWLDAPEWRKSLRYEADTLVTRAECVHDRLGVTLLVSDCVAHNADILLRRIDVTDRHLADSPYRESREVRLFFSHDFHLSETDIGDTAFYNPYLDGILHYKRDIYFLMSGTGGGHGLFQYTTGIKGFRGAEGTWRDAEDGWLSLNPVEQGSVDSTLSLRASVRAGETVTFHAWTCVAHTMSGITALQEQVRTVGFETLRANTRRYWIAWSRLESAQSRLCRLPAPIADLFRRSLLIMRTQFDNRGAILAANDSDIMETARAHYSYMWPRDGALVAAALDQLGYQDITRRFFLFCQKVLPQDRAALMHKYSADGSWGATWHPWFVNGHSEIPFQQDSTALVLWSLCQHYERYGDLEFLDDLYTGFVLPCGDFLVSYRDPQTGLPLPSYDLWEERRGVHAFTCGTTYGALCACARMARIFGEEERAVLFDRAAEEVRAGIQNYLWDEGVGRYVRLARFPERFPDAGGTMPSSGSDDKITDKLISRTTTTPDTSTPATVQTVQPVQRIHCERDLTIDSAVYGLWAFGAIAPDDPRMVATMHAVHERLRIKTEVGGQARYENDYYFRRTNDIARVPGNPWIICTLWEAQYHIATANTLAELNPAMQLLNWCVSHAAESGVLPEQLDPFTSGPLSVSPLTWSHAEFVSTVLLYLDRLESLSV